MTPPDPQESRDARALEQLRFELQQERRRLRELAGENSLLRTGLASVKTDIERIADSKAWRWGHRATSLGARLTGRVTRTSGAVAGALERIEYLERSIGGPLASGAAAGPAPSPSDVRVTQRRDPRELGHLLRQRLGAIPELDHTPPVSLVVATRDGLDLLKGLVDGLVNTTDYPALELIVADNASEDGTTEWLEVADLPFETYLCPGPGDRTYAESCNEAAQLAKGELLLFVNNDIEPVEAGWLHELVAALRPDVSAVGATLAHGAVTDPEASSGWITQHRGIVFDAVGGTIRPRNLGDGDDLFGAHLGIEVTCPAVTGACVLLRRAEFERIGGFPQGYRFGTEDVELGLQLTAGGGVVRCSGRAVLLHRESSTQTNRSREFRRLNRAENHKLLSQRWGPALRREYRLDRLRRGGTWSDGGPHAALTVTRADASAGWGDWYTAHELGDALETLGWRVSYIERKDDRWYDLPADLDYVVALLDTFDVRRAPPSVVSVAWIRNWTDRWLERPWFDRFDVMLTSSAESSRLVEQATGRPSELFPLATNPTRFAPAPDRGQEDHDYIFTGNRWGQDRDVQTAIAPVRGERVALYGRGWDEVPELRRYAQGPIAYDDLPLAYASAKLVLDDTAGPTLPYGALNTRVFDALASGTLVLTNCVTGARELFDGDFPVWTSRADLRARLDELLADAPRRESLVRRYRTQVLRHHTYAHRARRLTDVLEATEQRLSYCIKIGAPDWQAATRWGDLPFAEGLRRELQRRGHRCLVQVLEEWEDPVGEAFDVVIVLRGLSRHSPKPGQLNVLWNISHPETLTGVECDGYDVVAVASPRFAEQLRPETTTPVIVLEQATDTRVFFPDPGQQPERELVFVGNSRNVMRRVLSDLLPTDHDLAVFGGDWKGLIDRRYVVAEHVASDDVRRIYSASAIVLADHWDAMRDHGFASNRLYDAAACGALVISDKVEGVEERFGGGVVTYGSRDELASLIDRFLADPEERARRGAEGRRRVLAGHTFAHRVERLLTEVEERMAAIGQRRRLATGSQLTRS